MPNNSQALNVVDVDVQQDAAGRFSLNDLHRAAGGEDRHKPSNWLRGSQAQELLQELSTAQIRAVEAIEGSAGGTFVVRELVYAYAMWISPRFHLQVIRAYDALVAGAALQAGPGGSRAPTLGQMVAAQRQAQRLIEAIGSSSNAAVQDLLHQLLASTCTALGVTAPALAELRTAAPPAGAGGTPVQGTLPGLEGGPA